MRELFFKQFPLFYYIRKGVIKVSEKDFIESLRKEIINQGGSLFEISLITNELVKNAINQGRSPKDVAWAILQ